MSNIKLSEKIELILGIFSQCKSDHTWYASQLEAEVNKENTLRHEIEGVGINHRTPPGYHDRAKLATELQEALIARRVAKDYVSITKPIADFLSTEIGRKMINNLQQLLGDARKSESKLVDRRFRKRQTVNMAPENPELKKSLDALINEWKKSCKSPQKKRV